MRPSRPEAQLLMENGFISSKCWCIDARPLARPSELGTRNSELGIVRKALYKYARARYKYPAQEPKPCPLDLSDVPVNLAPFPSDTPGSSSRFKGVRKDKKRKKWQAEIWIPSKGGTIHLGTFDSKEEAGIMYARARYKYPAQEQTPTGLPTR